jgi:hypothetical protein
MKRVVLVAVICLMAKAIAAQVIFRNDFVINRKQRKLENKGLTFVSINLSSYPNWNQLINGRGGSTMVIDVQAIRNPRREYTYQEIAEKIYLPTQLTGPVISKVPLFLLMPPPQTKKIPATGIRHRNSVL